MHIRPILELKRPTFQPETWLPEVMAWLPTPYMLYLDALGDTMAVAHTVGDEPEETLFVCHLDTVHRRPGHQTIHPVKGFSQGWVTSTGECLGADDGAGLWLMLELIEAGVTGTYLFHLGEESGCRGSRWMAEHHADWLQGFTRCIGLDRPGTTDVVTHFVGTRGCSQAFAEQISGNLSYHLNGYSLTPCNRGGLTDAMHYIGLIPECTNISVGYHQQHSPREWLDSGYLRALKWALIEVLGGGALRLRAGQQAHLNPPDGIYGLAEAEA